MTELVGLGFALFLASIAGVAAPIHRLAGGENLESLLCWRNRLVTAGFVLAFLLITVGCFPEPRTRAAYQYYFVITLGYGHLIGGASFGRHHLRRMIPSDLSLRPFLALVTVSILVLFVLYGAVLATSPTFFFLMLSLSTWHIVENDLGMGDAYRNRLRAGPIPVSADHHWMALGLATLVAALSWATLPGSELRPILDGTLLDGVTNNVARILAGSIGVLLVVRNRMRPAGVLGLILAGAAWMVPVRVEGVWWFGFSEVFAGVTLYHLVSWLVLFADRARTLVPGTTPVPSLGRRLAWVHALPAVLCGTVFFLYGTQPSAPAYWLLSPGIYLFWSVLHVFQTAAVRGWASPEVEPV